MSRPPGVPLHLLYGGTFDPIHLGHLAVARAALSTTGAAHLDFLPAADPPHRAAPGASFTDRVALLRAALASEPAPSAATWGVDVRESQRADPSYTVDTLREWRRDHGESRPLGFVLGADAFLGLTGWREWTALFDLAHLLVARRPGSALHTPPPELAEATAGRWWAETDTDGAIHALQREPAGRVVVIDLPLRTESATAVREALGRTAIAEGVPAAVAALIRARGLYGGPTRDGAPG
jgi:nicotinate-nucleotide adenylyltransferase